MLLKDESKRIIECIDMAEEAVGDESADIKTYYADLRKAVRAVTCSVAARPTLSLTPREREVFDGLVGGISNQDIATSLRISPKTVDTHRAALMKKLGLTGTVNLVLWAMRNGFVRP